MSNLQLQPLDRRVFETRRLMAEHPPIWDHPNKRVVFAIACPRGCSHEGELIYGRWAGMALPETVDPVAASRRVACRESFYDYSPLPPAGSATEWHVNFADRNLFGFYGSSLFAQDEVQVAEHPALGALKEALNAEGIRSTTVEHGEPTPVLIMGAERRCRVATDRNASEGRPSGLYGNAFASAREETVRRATERIDPPTVTNLIAMAALAHGSGRYNVQEINYVLKTAFTAFFAAATESNRQNGASHPVVVHTGFWGCGAFGGSRVLMAALQALAAEMAGLERLVFHTSDAKGTQALNDALVLLKGDSAGAQRAPLAELVQMVAARGFEWGVGDGN